MSLQVAAGFCNLLILLLVPLPEVKGTVPGVSWRVLFPSCRIPGRLNDRRTPLGELNWIFTAITDTIAWNVLPRGEAGPGRGSGLTSLRG